MKASFVCQQCGYISPKWLGRCPECGAWNSFVEEAIKTPKSKSKTQITSLPKPIREISGFEVPRISSGLAEFDRVLGGGMVSGAVALIGGPPGIGKSTLTLQVLNYIAEQGYPALYVSGEESSAQIKLRADRLNATSDKLFVLAANEAEAIIEAILALKPKIVVVDSIQTLFLETLSSAPGSVSQVREVTHRLIQVAKKNNISLIIIGHVTKEGAIAGPRLLEHMVDTVLYFEGDKAHPYRILRAVKNRFGSTNEVGIFEMSSRGLIEVKNPSEMFLAERPKDVPGSVVVPIIEGTRPFLVEIQSLVTPSFLAIPRRTALGVDNYRFNLLMAILEKRLNLNLGNQDIFLNVAGGIKVNETAADLGIVLAVASSFLNKVVAPDWVFLGEVGLTGEVRAVTEVEKRLKESQKLGFHRALIPRSNYHLLKKPPLKTIGIKGLQEALEIVFD